MDGTSKDRSERAAALSPAKRELLEQRLRGRVAGSAASAPIRRRRANLAPRLSFAQQRLWFLDQLAPGNPFYTIPIALRMNLPLSVGALEATINQIVARHEALRTRFVSQGSEPSQMIADHQTVPLPLIDLRGLPESEREPEVARLATLDAGKPFDLERGPLIRTSLVQLADADFVFLLAIHHIVADGWSMDIFSRELSALYSAHLAGQPAQLPDLPIQYADFAEWQREWLQGEVLAEQLGYWRQQLADFPVLQLATDRPRPAVQAFRGAYYPFSIDASASEGLRALSRREGVTLFMTLLAAFYALLHRYTGQDDLLVGSPIANRNRREIEPLIGFFVNSLVLRTNASGDPSFLELLHRVRRVSVDAYAHQDLPFEMLVEELQPARDPSRNPLFQVTFQLFNAPNGDGRSGDSPSPLVVQRQTAIFDIAFTLLEGAPELRGGFEYDTDLFDHETIARMGAHLRSLVGGVLEDPTRRLSELPLLTAPERHQLLVTWQDTAVTYDRSGPLDCFLADAVAKHADLVAVDSPAGSLTYRELDARAGSLAAWLQAQGIGPDRLVAVCVERSIDLVVSLIAVLKAGGAYVPLDPGYPSERLAFMLDDCGATVLLTARAVQHVLPDTSVNTLCLDASEEWRVCDARGVRSGGRSMEDLAYVIYTSGSTGRPKGVMIPHRAICNHMHWMQHRFPLSPEDRVLQRTPASFDASVWEFYAPLLAGACLVLAPPDWHKDPVRLAELLRDQRITILQLVPSLLEALIDETDGDRARDLRRVFCGGEPLTPRLANRFRDRFPATELCNLYGPTECTIDTIYWTAPARGRMSAVPIGRPVSNTRVHLLDGRGHLVPIGVPGEIHLAGTQLARGYLNRPELTSERFAPDPFASEPGARLYRTGDVARYRANGDIEYLGRRDHQIKIRGYRVEVGEIEALLQQHAGVGEAVVLCREDSPGDQRLVAYVVPRTDASDSAAAQTAVRAHADSWQHIFDETHRLSAPDDPLFDFRGWNSTFTGLPIDVAEMREWVDRTVERIRAVRPRRVLEIGCGTGLLLLRLAPECEVYWATDVSEPVLNRLGEHVRARGLSQVRLLHQAANVLDVGSEQFDLVILNSVTEYFPSVEYALDVLRRAVRTVVSGGRVFVGDVRSLPLLTAFHSSVEMQLADDRTTLPTVRARVERRLAEERQLVLAPAFFDVARSELTNIGQVELTLKRGHCQNEMTCFRYSVWLHIGGRHAPGAVTIDELTWGTDVTTLDQLRSIVGKSDAPGVRVNRMLNARVVSATHVERRLGKQASSDSVADLRRECAALARDGIDPEDVWDLGAELGWSTHLTWSEDNVEDLDRFDALLLRDLDQAPCMPPTVGQSVSVGTCANDPIRGWLLRELVPALRRQLQRQLPEYMVPSSFVLLDHLPLAPNGKVDRAKLPAPEADGRDRLQTRVPPRTPTERRLAAIWTELLGVPDLGVHDNFFTALGGHSLLGTQLVSRVRRAFRIELPLQRLFEAPTIADLAVRVDEACADPDRPQTGTIPRLGDGAEIAAGAGLSQLSSEHVDLMLQALLSTEEDHP